MEAFLAAEDDLAELTEGLEFGNNQHEVKLTRTRSNPPGVTKGFLDSFFRRITTTEIRDLYGGGEFLYTVWGPDPSGRRVCKSKKTISIEGLSLVNGLPATGSVIADQNNSAQKDMVKVLLADKEREANRLFEEIKELKKAQTEFLQRDTTAPLLAMMKEATDKQIAAAKDLADREEKRLAREALEREAERTRAEAREAQRRQEEKDRLEDLKGRAATELNTTLQMMQSNTNLLIASFKDNASSKEAGFATILQAVQAASQQTLQTMQANFSQQVSMASQQMGSTIQQMQSAADLREKMLMEALKDAKSSNKGDMVSQLADLAKIKNTMDVVFNTGAPPPGGIVDGIKEFVSSPAAATMVQAFMGGRGGQPQVPPGTPPGMLAPPVAVGSVQVSGPRAELVKGPSPWPTTTGSPLAPPPPPEALPRAKARKPSTPPTPVMVVPPAPGQQPIMPQPQPQAAAALAPTVESLGVAFPVATDTDEAKFESLIRALDAAMRADWSTENMFNLLIPKFPEDVPQTLKETPFDRCLQVIELMAPTSVLNTAQGTQVMRELFSMLGVPQ
jgi:hypothetical protein